MQRRNLGPVWVLEDADAGDAQLLGALDKLWTTVTREANTHSTCHAE